MAKSLSVLHELLIQLSEPIFESLSETKYTPPEGSDISIKSILESLFPRRNSPVNPNPSSLTENHLRTSIKDFTLACALLSSSQSSTHDLLSWIHKDLSSAAESAFRTLSMAYATNFFERNSVTIGELGLDYSLIPEEKKLVLELIPEVLPLLKERIKESSIDKTDEVDEVSAASARTPVGFAIVAAYQFRWFVTQVDYPHLGKSCTMVIPCALTALDHWSPEVKGQSMISFIHLVKNVNSADLSWYEEVILDACCHNIAASDEIWCYEVEMSVLLATSIQQSNPRSSWFERMLNEMLSHLERQPRNKERRISWLQHIEPVFNCVGLVLLAHTRRLFPLFFQWMKADDDETLLLVLQRLHTVLKLTWIRNTPYVERVVDELALLFNKVASSKGCEEIRTHILQILLLLQQCKGTQFEAAWKRHKDDPELITVAISLSGSNSGNLEEECIENHNDLNGHQASSRLLVTQ